MSRTFSRIRARRGARITGIGCRGLKYPSSPEQAEHVAAQIPEERDRLQVIRYGLDHWDAARIEAEMKQAAEWARRRGVPLVCDEFGVYRAYSDPEDRARGCTMCGRRSRTMGSGGRCGIIRDRLAW